MSIRRKYLVWLTAIIVVVLGGIATVLWNRNYAERRCDAYERIAIGMTEEEVEGTLGEPGRGWISEKRVRGKAWLREDCLIEVSFDKRNNQVVGKSLTWLPKPTLLEGIRKVLRL